MVFEDGVPMTYILSTETAFNQSNERDKLISPIDDMNCSPGNFQLRNYVLYHYQKVFTNQKRALKAMWNGILF